MHKSRTIPISNQIDIHAARMYTREAARIAGLELVEQARISLATSTLAECLKMGSSGPGQTYGQVNILFLENGSRKGLQIVFEVVRVERPSTISKEEDMEWAQELLARVQNQLHKIQPLVDDVSIEISPTRSLQVSMVKWEPNTGEHPALSKAEPVIPAQQQPKPDGRGE